MSKSRATRPRHSALFGAILLCASVAGCSKAPSAPELLAQARQFQQQGERKSAVIQLKNALQLNPADVEARLFLAQLQLEGEDPVSAENEVRKAMALAPGGRDPLPLLSQALLAQGKYQQLLQETEAGAAKAGPELLSRRGQAYLGLDKPEPAEAAFRAALKLQPDSPEALVGLARLANTRHDLAASRALAQRAVAANPRSVDAWLFMGDVERAELKFAAADAAYDKVIALSPNHVQAHLQKAYLDIEAHRFDAARKQLALLRKVSPSSIVVTYTQALLDFTEGNPGAALEPLQQALKLAPEHMPTLLLAGAVQYQLGALAQAEQHLGKYVRANPDNQYARKLLASTLLRGGQQPDALAVLAPVIKLPEVDPQLLALAGESYMQVRDFNKASDFFQQASVRAPAEASVRTALGLSELGKGDQAAGLRELAAAAKLDAKSLAAGGALVRSQIELKQYDAALAAAQQLARAQPQAAEPALLGGVAQWGRGDLVAARAAFELALRLQPSYYLALANLANLDVKEGKPAAAKARLLAYLAQHKDSGDAMAALSGLANTAGRTAEATDWLEQARAAHPDAVAPAVLLGAQYLRSEQKAKALTLARALQAANPAQPEVLDLLGQAQLANDAVVDAVETYHKLTKADPKSPVAQFRLASAYLRANNEAAAGASLKRALALEPDFVEADLALAELAQRRGRFDEALALAKRIQRKRPAQPVGYMLEGDFLIQQRKAAPALAAYEKAQALSAEVALKVKLADAMIQAGQAKAAEQRVLGWIAAGQDGGVLRVYLAENYLREARYPAAIEQLEAVLKQTPGNPGALNNLAWAYFQNKDGRALATAELALKAAPDNPGVLDTLGWLLVEQGDTARGLPLLRRAAEAAAQATEIRFHLASGLMRAGEKAAARKEFEQLLAGGKNFPQAEQARALLKQL